MEVDKDGHLFKKGNSGRPKGSVNKLTVTQRTFKETVLEEITRQQTDPKAKWPLKKFADKYPRDFYAIAARLIPTEIRAHVSQINLHIVRTGCLPSDQNASSVTGEGSTGSEAV